MTHFHSMGFKKHYSDIRLEGAEKYSCISRPPSRNDGEGLPEAVASITLLIIKHSHIEVSNEEKKTLQKH